MVGRAAGLVGLGKSFNPSEPPSVGKPETPSDDGPPGLLMRRGRPSMGRETVKEDGDALLVRERAGDPRRGVEYVEDCRLGTPSMGPVEPDGPASVSSM